MEIDPRKYPLATKNIEGKVFVHCIIRKKYIELTPEEFVRQVLIQHLHYSDKIPLTLIGVEKGFKVNGREKRFDAVVYEKDGTLDMLIECKKPEVKIDEKVLLQAVNYNQELGAKRILLSNGPVTKIYLAKGKTII